MNENQNTLTVPVAIVLAGLIIAGGIIATKYVGTTNIAPAITDQPSELSVNIPPVTDKDHIIGRSDADLVFVEYSDTECPFCKVFHGTMHQLVSEFGPSNKVAWVYRHLPLSRPDATGRALHPRAQKEAEASECVADQKGNDGFWKYIDEIYKTTPANNGLDPAKLTLIAKQQGVDIAKFTTCLSTGTHKEAVEKSYDEGFAAGAQGTPYVVIISKKKLSDATKQEITKSLISIITKASPRSAVPPNLVSFDEDGTKITFSGALPYDFLKSIVSIVTK